MRGENITDADQDGTTCMMPARCEKIIEHQLMHWSEK